MYFPTLIITNLLLQTGLYLFATGSFPFMLSHTFEYLFRVYVVGLILPCILVIKDKLNFNNNSHLFNLISWYLVILTGHFNIYDQHFEKEFGFYPSNLLVLFVFFITIVKNFINNIKKSEPIILENNNHQYKHFITDSEEDEMMIEEKVLTSDEDTPKEPVLRKRQHSFIGDINN